MIGLKSRQALARDNDAAHAAGARLRSACEVAGTELRTLKRWQARDGGAGCRNRAGMARRSR